MLDRNCYSYIHIGLLIRLFANIQKGASKSFTQTHLGYFDTELKKAGFEVSAAYINASNFSKVRKSIENVENNSQIGEDISNELSSHFKTIEHIVFAESTTKKVYILPSRRFNTEILLNNPDELLAQGQFDKLNEIARSDISSASRCIIFGEATAAAFHILRATEAVLKQYYFHHRRQNRLAHPMWANMVDQLRSKKRSKPPTSLTSTLDLIRITYRNPTQHPESIYTIDSAQDLFGVCLDVIGKMSTEL